MATDRTPAEILAEAKQTGEDGYDPFESFDEANNSALPNPYPVFAELRAECPVHAGSQSHRFDESTTSTNDLVSGDRPQYGVYTFAGVEQVLRDGELFSSAGYAESMGLVMGHTILEMDEPEHGRYRRLIQQAFTKKEMDRWEREYVRPLVHFYIDAFAARGRADLVGEFTFMYPVHVIATAIGLPIDELPWFYRSAVEITNMAAEPMRGFAASQALYDRMQALITERRAAPAEDLISLLARAEVPEADGGSHQLTDDEIIAFLRLLLPAGAETTYRSTSNLLFGLLTHPDQLAAVRDDPSLVPQAIEEALRWEPPLTGISRRATQDVELEGVAVPAGAQIQACMGAANHDPDRYERPEAFDIHRPAKGHLAFATGPHLCLGIHLARMEMRVALEAVLDRLPNVRLDPDAGDVEIRGLGFRAPRQLPVVFDPTP